ncbi:MAG: benzoate/H(+) symporter BenE family transporter [Rhodospirillaceae bacterium]|jgi:benzoate membrane transport protein|nr:benzoate/H(+) symporter BenE family transporter [Rhodospirillaceae bacterium]MBT4045178.1 benzoate/H(+) symporter BenE family transporter [Rhodospirillaceae bacterium]MBT4690497.1 benzoate/H(+) symporter BenE family transporter [Rhodospirillaceae bacterium]MBT5083215.1 benzoate/H(+) symporter BenE family transporter [Rhodospirillaceae bacterium]MBT5526518.1 benzoate/H(+) symporter BenE family transporter [Rhodospirillaceae bacterium]
MFRDFSVPALYMGLLAAFVGYSASFAIVLAGITAMGATAAQAATGLFFATIGMGICSIWLPASTRTPAAVAWSTPGAAFLAATAALPGGFGEAVGALLFCAGLIVLTGFVPGLGRIVAAIPKPIANGLLAGVLLKLCLAPALALGTIPVLILPVLVAWLIGLSWNKLAAMPFAVMSFVFVLYFSLDMPESPIQEGFGQRNFALLPELTAVAPIFTFQAFISIALPLYLVTMAGQNIPGFAVLELNKYTVDRQPLIRKTGLVSLAIAPFGAIPVNMSAITAAMMAGEDAGRDPAGRYWAAITSGVAYVLLAFAAATVASLASFAPAALITAVAGLALIPALVGSISAAFSVPGQLEAPALTFLIAASGMTLFGVSGAFWGIVAGAIIWFSKSLVR